MPRKKPTEKLVKSRDPEQVTADLPRLKPDEITIDDLHGRIIKLSPGEVFWKIPNSTAVTLTRFGGGFSSFAVPKTLEYYEYEAILDGLRFGRILLSNDPNETVVQNEQATFRVMNPDQWSIAAYRILDTKDTALLQDMLTAEDNLLTLERALEIEQSERRRSDIIDSIKARINIVKR